MSHLTFRHRNHGPETELNLLVLTYQQERLFKVISFEVI